MIDVNDVEARISVLYRLTDPFLKLAPVRPVHVEKKQKTDDPTGKTFQITVSGGPTSEIDKLDAQVLLNNIIHHLANLKDNLKNKLKKKILIHLS